MTREEWKSIPINSRPLFSLGNTYTGLLDDIDWNVSLGTTNVFNISNYIDIVINKLKVRKVFYKDKYNWLRNEQLLEYLKSQDFDTFMVGYQILEEEGIV